MKRLLERLWDFVSRIETIISVGGFLASLGLFAWIGSKWDKLAEVGWAAIVIFAALCACAVVIAVSLAYFAISHFRTHGLGKASRYVDTRLRIRADPNGTLQYLHESASNIYGWRQTYASIEMATNGKKEAELNVDGVVIAFDKPIHYDRPVINTFGHKTSSYNFLDLGMRGAAFQFIGLMQAPVIEIWFPPAGYHESKGAAEGAFPQSESPLETQARARQ